MGDIDFKLILFDCMAFARADSGSSWKKIKPFAEHEFLQFAENIFFLIELKLSGIIEADEFLSRLHLQKVAISNCFIIIKGMGIADVQEVVNEVEQIIYAALQKELNIELPLFA